jgi:hypothetical protein
VTEPFQPKYADLDEARLLIRTRYPELDPDKALIAACCERRLPVTKSGRPFLPKPGVRPDIAWQMHPFDFGQSIDVKFLRTDLNALWPDPKNKSAKAKNPGGRPPRWDWEGAWIEVVLVANTPDGLPTGRGAQAEIERIMHDWFVATFDAAPSTSDIRARAHRIMARLTKTETSLRPFPADTGKASA